jgi:hypothetical protein
MKKIDVIIAKISKLFTEALFQIGNSANLTNIKPFESKVKILSDQEALKRDWEAVGQEVLLAIGRFEREYALNERKA